MTKMRNRFTELKQGRPEPPNASLLEVLACRVDPSYLTSLSDEIRSTPQLNSPACLQRSIFSLPSQICRPLFFVWKARSRENFLSKRSFFCKSSQSAGQVSFSLSSAPYLFPKLLKPLVKKWRSEGKHIVVFLDDSLGAAFNHIKAKIYSLAIHSDLFKSGSTEIIHKLRLQT